ncbi:MAG: tRNA (guanine-N1)-methyltransferase [Candidatus Diapherotrites archaeon]|uniref:tRNA (Guanine-N1)-methyltransferase n=1 Tax=Candidatus Iainarchaeum sp. TaxID=3101447 RepID=A0A2D6LZR9_9ARCH|nr:tRNA (guanine-N1)-methyltransferase [Candidatus Diapherotrites archaeon]|tara:strand:- start:1765 stop:2610 length:846 start_codon:yes stop_codon:yes gene_type:complete
MNKPRNLKDALKKKLSKREMQFLRTSYDSVGNIAVIEIPPELEKKEALIGEALLEVNPQFETVCRIVGAHKGFFRIQPVKVIAGKRNKTATYRESGCILKVNLGKVFFSPRLSHERERIAKLIKKGEVVGAFFAGVGPFPLVFAKNSEMKKAIAIELNPHAVENMRENIILNKQQERVEAVLGDVNKVVPKKYKGKFDRVVMPLPKGGENFLAASISSIKSSGGVVHFYQFVPIDDPYSESLKLIREECKKQGRKCRVLSKKKVRSFSARAIQVVIDFRVK